jgi:hypothetical protein
MSGKNLVDLAVDISTKDVPVIKTAYQNMCQNECIEALN